MNSKQRAWGQFATPVDVADLLLGFCLRRPDDLLLDPGCGDGALLRRAAHWRAWLASGRPPPPTLYGVELDPTAAASAADLPGAVIEQANFFTLNPDDYPRFDAIVGNPPYTRAEWIDRLDVENQPSLFPANESPAEPPTTTPLLPRELGKTLSGRAGLYAFFLLHSLGFLREGGRLGFVVPNGWLDVAYGEGLKRFILDHFRVVAVVESAVERWFAAARVNTCLIILERTDEQAARRANRVRFVRLRQPLAELLGRDTDSRRIAAVEQLVTRLLPALDRQTAGAATRVIAQGELGAAERWGTYLRAPEFFLHPSSRPVAPLGEWADVQRGYTTGANDFFILDPQRGEEWGIEPKYRRPLLKSLRGIHAHRVSRSDCRHELLLIPPGEQLADTAAAGYLEWGAQRGIPERPTCAMRRPWYALPEQEPGAVFLAKGVWQRHFAPVAVEPIAVDQQLYRIIPLGQAIEAGVTPQIVAALLNSTWFALACELGGRVNFGEGVLWLASYEIDRILLPDPRALAAGERRELAAAFGRLAMLPVADTVEMLLSEERRALDELVFDLIGLSTSERAAAREVLVECLTGRRRRAKKPRHEEKQPDVD